MKVSDMAAILNGEAIVGPGASNTITIMRKSKNENNDLVTLLLYLELERGKQKKSKSNVSDDETMYAIKCTLVITNKWHLVIGPTIFLLFIKPC
ncbi:hypothetical protein HanLR1_Chr06g0198041 [Helianthus annuus]|nr:hypothetical protein HanLR1_Chr06g0198041 [Helianthus annuus]